MKCLKRNLSELPLSLRAEENPRIGTDRKGSLSSPSPFGRGLGVRVTTFEAGHRVVDRCRVRSPVRPKILCPHPCPLPWGEGGLAGLLNIGILAASPRSSKSILVPESPTAA